MGQLPGDIDIHGLKAGDTVGLLHSSNGTLHFFLNGVHMVRLPCTVPNDVYGLVDLYGQCVKVSLKPLIHWEKNEPLHVMADNKDAHDWESEWPTHVFDFSFMP